jgi:hypothetical protein
MVEADSLKQHAQERTVNRRLDPADLANRIRKLAADTHRTLRSQHADPHELIEFALSIDELRHETQDPHLIEIDRWLRKVKDLIETRWRSANQIDPKFLDR